ncbi:MAG TPA: ABC-F family ATP-binding cassette domain-containing protein [Thermomicrobiales bacterium]|nr:ABC-F family ATP-binding cassette domain-containing protein [Thermomicrobiales bacterium]
MMLSVLQVSKAWGSTQVLSNVSLLVNDGERAGLVGANGAGKSTLLRIITGEMQADIGSVAIASGAIVGYLPQQPPDAGSASIDDLVYDSIGSLREIETRLRLLEARMAIGGDELAAELAEYGELADQFERRGGYDLDHRINIVFAGLSIDHLPRERRFATLSGGEQARVQLATLLLKSPDLLLLDEPTNHLDFARIAWLETYLAGYRGSVLAISHDRRFLNRTVTKIVEVDEHAHAATEYVGDYDAYALERARQRERWEIEYQEQLEEIADLKRVIRTTGHQVAHNRPQRDPAKTTYDFKGGRVASAVSRNVRNAEERVRRIEEDPIPKPPSVLSINPAFDPDELRSEIVISAQHVSHRFDGKPVLDELSLTLGPRDRVVIVGPNGAGKSTLLDIIAGQLEPESGLVTVAPTARVGYLDQDGRSLRKDRSVLDTYRDGLIGYEDEFISDLFRYGLFALDDLPKHVGELSAGQRRKLQIARLVAEKANVLLLDEPTNHLSFDILEAFEDALVSFPGPIIAVSHDRWFIERFGGRVLTLVEGRLLDVVDVASLASSTAGFKTTTA